MPLKLDTPSERAIALATERGIARARDFRAAGIPLVYLKRLCDEGHLVQLGRGLYQIPEIAGSDAEHNLAEAARFVPNAIICLLSALRHHGLTTQLPQAVWLTIPHKARKPKAPSFLMEIVYATEPMFSAGLEHIQIEGVDVPIYGAAKTVADCFKYRRRVGLDVAVEALRDAIRLRKSTPAELMHYGSINRVANLMRPYLEALA
ncbi:MAG TPA: type IV toxin-antitoxin system AbiEi family antitoxin domain-containing protein [Gemmataceae bacterium]|nr:type IV toxin-antitoxin system AbiEi family antitoxin domain-containing protein [Gemmataceae bacterium]